jgi:hypothetical protein
VKVGKLRECSRYGGGLAEIWGLGKGWGLPGSCELRKGKVRDSDGDTDASRVGVDDRCDEVEVV